jgi:hypothetical protein
MSRKYVDKWWVIIKTIVRKISSSKYFRSSWASINSHIQTTAIKSPIAAGVGCDVGNTCGKANPTMPAAISPIRSSANIFLEIKKIGKTIRDAITGVRYKIEFNKSIPESRWKPPTRVNMPGKCGYPNPQPL